jgi:hypothetical protein
MAARKRRFYASVASLLLAAFVLAQVVVASNACAFTIPDCPGGGVACIACDEMSGPPCWTAEVQSAPSWVVDRGSTLVPAELAVAAGFLVVVVPPRRRSRSTWRNYPAHHQAARNTFCRMLE